MPGIQRREQFDPRSTSSMYVEGWNVHRVIRPARLANAVVERLLLRILEGEFPPGTDLPPEAALAAEFAVSRTILREALKALEEKRVLRIRHGRGTTVRPKAEWNLLDPLVLSVQLEYESSPALVEELGEVRTALLTLMAELAARRIHPVQREQLAAALERMRAAAEDPAPFHEAAVAFTRTLAEAAGNEVARCVIETIDVPHGGQDDDPGTLAEAMKLRLLLAEAAHATVAAGPGAPAGSVPAPAQA
ncbi:MAG: FadR family transcriptional regulator, partial [Catenulispora sp.]|nr:FadR family transcriptional regulator [Catenulispora sp.]